MKTRESAPPGFFAAEAAGLAWLAEAAGAGGVATVRPVSVDRQRLALPHVEQRTPTAADAEAFGRALARTHLSGAPHHGCPPPGLPGDGFIATLPLRHASEPPEGGWAGFYASHRLAPYLAAAGAEAAGRRVLDRLCNRLAEGSPDLAGPPEPASRLHGDLWSGNVLWSADGAVLVDPAAHGGHRETDLAMLALFGLPFLDRVLAAYDEVHPLADGWRDRVALHQVHPLLVHAALFGGGYGSRAVAAARRYV